LPTLLSQMDSNPKVAKNTKRGWGTAVLHLAPAGMSGYQVCQGRSAGCEAACLHYSGDGRTLGLKTRGRVRKTKMFFEDRDAFMALLVKEMGAHIRKCEKLGLKPAARLNATSDLPWERIRHEGATMMELFPGVQFYDYTKVLGRKLPENYHLTFSLSENNDEAAKQALTQGLNLAVVFPEDEFPDTFWGLPVVSGDDDDFRPADPTPAIIGLKVKGWPGKADDTGFVRRGLKNAQ
jgi:hypothetical protein